MLRFADGLRGQNVQVGTARLVDNALILSLADLADEFTLQSWQKGDAVAGLKSDGSPVTSTDVEVERRIRDRVLAACPGDSFVSEELGVTAGMSGRCWFVDGIDGTTAFVARRPEWSTLIALADANGVFQGICSAPALGTRWYVEPDGYAVALSRQGWARRLQVSAATASESVKVACWPPASQMRGRLSDAGRSRLGALTHGRTIRASWGAGVPNSAMLVAQGTLDGFVLVGGGSWDHAAAAAIVTAAGGAWSDLSGRHDLNAAVVVFSNGSVHRWLLDQLRHDHRRHDE